MLRDLMRQAWKLDDDSYLQAQVELIQRNLTLNMVCCMLVCGVVAAEYVELSHNTAIWGWAAWMWGWCLLGLWLGMRGPQIAQGHQLKKTLPMLRWLAAGLGGGWGGLVMLFMRTDDPYTTTLVLSAAAGASAGGLMLFGPVWPLTLIFLTVTASPVAAALLMSNSHAELVLGLAVLIYTVFLAAFSYQAARVVRESIALRFENDELVARLQEESQRASRARQLAEDALRDAEEANRAKVTFLAATSHDLRQPLHALGLFASALGRTTLSLRQRGLLAQIDASADAARDMLSTLLDFSKVDAGVITARMRPVALQPMLHRLEKEFAPQAMDLGLFYRTHDTRAVVHADAALVERILRNLIANALRYTERGGVLVGVRRRGDVAVVEVWDTGVGIPLHQHQAVFREFHQLGNPERDRRKGLGLGLAIVDGLARAMSTEVTLASNPGRGSVFRLNLPLSQEAAQEVGALAGAGGDLSGARILVIDDDETVRAAMAELFTSWGAWCEVVESADEAVGILARFTPQVVVADYRLRSHRHGYEAIEAVRRQARRKIPAVLVTGDTAADRIREAQASGVTLLHKPVPASQLHQVLSELLRGDELNGGLAAGSTESPASAAG